MNANEVLADSIFCYITHAKSDSWKSLGPWLEFWTHKLVRLLGLSEFIINGLLTPTLPLHTTKLPCKIQVSLIWELMSSTCRWWQYNPNFQNYQVICSTCGCITMETGFLMCAVFKPHETTSLLSIRNNCPVRIKWTFIQYFPISVIRISDIGNSI